MKKLFTLLAAVLMTASFVSAQPSQRGPVKASAYPADAQPFSIEKALKQNKSILKSSPARAMFSGEDGHADVYGYVLYDNRYRSYIWSKFSTSNPMDYSMIRDFGTAQGADVYQTATFVGDRLFAQRCYLYFQGYWVPRSFGWLDPQTGEFEDCFEWITLDNLFRDMTYDPVSNKIYLVDTDDPIETADIYTIDPDNPTTITKAFHVDVPIVMLSADNGVLYGIVPNEIGKNNTRLVKINTTSINTAQQTATVEEIRASGMNISIAFDRGDGNRQIYWQSMEIDKTNHRMWWNANTSDGTSKLCEINYNKGTIISTEPLSTNPEFVALSIPYQTAADNAPSYVRNLQAEAGANGALTAKFTWTNPSETYMGDALASLSGVKVYRDGQLVNTVSTTAVGGEVAFEDTNVASGIHTYKFQTYNSAGDGIYKDADLFVGRDTPDRVGMLSLEAQGNSAVVSWIAPSRGQNGGWIDAASLTYRVVRYPGKTVVADGIAETSFVDNSITTWQGYYYEVTPSTSDGEGLTAATNVLPMGPAMNLPYTNDMNTQDLFNEWKVIDNNYGYGDGTKWEYDSFRNLAFYYSTANDADDYLVSPKLNFEAGKEYQVRYTYFTSNWVFPDNHEPIMEKMQVLYGQQPTAAGLNTLVKDLGEFHTSSANYLYGKDNFTPNAGEGYIAFKATSEGDHGIIYLHSISIREYSDKDLSVTNLTASAMANVNIAQQATVEVTNEGKSAVSNYTVEIFNAETGEVLSTANGVNINQGEKKNISISWTPKQKGAIKISAQVVLEGDTYPADNIWNSNIEVVVSDEDGALWFAGNTDDKINDPAYGALNVGWNGPVHLFYNTSRVQQIFLENEMRKGVYLKGLQFVYDGTEDTDGLHTDVVIKMKQTNLEHLQLDSDATDPAYDPGWGFFEEGTGWTEVYNGSMDFESSKENSIVTIMFDNEYKYEGGNLIIQYDRNDYSIDNPPYWHFYKYKESELRRTAFARSNSGSFTDVFAYEYATHTRFAYRDDQTGINQARNNKSVTISQSGDNVIFYAVCSTVEVYNTSGTRVVYAKNISSFNTRSLPKGVYMIKAHAEGATVAKKLVVK